MFSNANVIFRTKFTDGVSTVTRTLGKSKSNKNQRPLTDSNGQNERGYNTSKRSIDAARPYRGVEN